MNLKKMAACTLAAMTLLGCATHQELPSSYRFDYQTVQSAKGVIRAFDDGQRTIVQFVDLAWAMPTFADSQGRALEYERHGQYAVLPQIVMPRLTVTTTEGVATFNYTGKPSTPPEVGADGVPGVVTETAPPARESVTTPEKAVPAAATNAPGTRRQRAPKKKSIPASAPQS